MDRVAPAHTVWSKRATFLALVLLICFFHLLPLDFGPRAWGWPDLIAAFAFAWSVRRPEYVPPVLLAAALLLADLLLQRPPGLWALLVLLGCEFLRARNGLGGEATFATEWLSVSIVLIVATVLMRVGLTVLAVPQPRLSVDVTQLIFTIGVYPVVVWVSKTLLGIERLSAAEADRMGVRS